MFMVESQDMNQFMLDRTWLQNNVSEYLHTHMWPTFFPFFEFPRIVSPQNSNPMVVVYWCKNSFEKLKIKLK